MLRTLKQLKNIKGKRVLLRVDFNVPIDRRGVTDDTRIRETLPTIKFLLKKKARVVVITHLGRPEGKVVDSLKLDAVSAALSKLLKKKVRKLGNCVGKSVEAAVKKMKDGEVALLENIRFHPEEEANDRAFSAQLAALGDLYVNDAFAACHRAHASIVGIAKLLPAYAGFLVEREIKMLTPLLSKPAHPLTLIVGGAKVDTKIGLLKNFFGKADTILIGGALANTFLAAEGYDIGKSLFEPGKIEVARDLLLLAEKKGQKIILPEDVIVADEVTQYAATADLPLEDIEGDMKILDIGSRTRLHFEAVIAKSKTIIWNGPMGLYEFSPFASGTRAIAETMARSGSKTKTYIGGGDTIDALKRLGIEQGTSAGLVGPARVPHKEGGRVSRVAGPSSWGKRSFPQNKITFISTGGGAMLEFLEGKALPGIKALSKA